MWFSAARRWTRSRISDATWSERHSLIMLIALGETIISIGTSRGFSDEHPITWSVLGGSALGFVVVAFLWWAYFDIASPAAPTPVFELVPQGGIGLACEPAEQHADADTRGVPPIPRRAPVEHRTIHHIRRPLAHTAP
ncbi:low temperature requirement protein A [Plantactinospora solaniradicis]|uniref:Low temperature requirement protein A n=1 Tax=Plantactinospora solaniradicis TaxID=1723736 RepID=A0ABW1KET1_9ACTN